MSEPKELRRVSYSQYSLWSSCRYSWKLAYHDKLKPEDNSINLIFGTVIHEAIQIWLDKLYNGTKVQAKHFDIGTYFEERLLELFKAATKEVNGEKVFLCDKETLKEFYLDGIAILDHVLKYQKDYFPKKAKLIGCEVALEVPLGKSLQFIGFIDLVVQLNDGTVIIYDFKTSTRGWYHEKKDPKKINQILLYKKFYSEVFDVPEEQIEVQFLILKRKIKQNTEFPIRRITKFEPSSGSPSIKKALKSWNEFINETFDNDGKVMVDNLTPSPSEKSCKYCAFKNRKDLCPTGYYKNE